MQKIFVLAAILFLSAAGVKAQSADTLEQVPVTTGMKDAAFHKVFSEIIVSGAHYFKNLENNTGIKGIIDTTYDLNFKFHEKNDARLTCGKNDVNLTINFNLDKDAFLRFFKNLNAELPSNYVYTREYDALAQQSNCVFFPKPGTTTTPAGYPEKIYMIVDASHNVILTFLLFR